jgi:hypothetical protein
VTLHRPAQHLLRAEDFVEDGAGAEELDGGLALFGGAEFVDAAENALLHAFGHGGHRVVLVVHGDVVEAVFAELVHAADAVLDYDGELVDEGGVVGDAGGDGACEDVAVAVLVLEAFAEHGGAARGAAHEEAFAAGIGGGPDHVAYSLESEHGVVHVEGNRRDLQG